MKGDGHDAKVVVLRAAVGRDEAAQIVDSKKTSPFRSMLMRPGRDQVHIHSLALYHECIIKVSGRYTADYYRKATHSISVAHNVNGVVMGKDVFPVRSKTALARALTGRRSKNRIDLTMDEHVHVREEETLYLDHHGVPTKFPFKTDPEYVEDYPRRVLDKNASNVRGLELTHKAAADKLLDLLKESVEAEARDITDEFALLEATEIYVPVFEARLVGPKKKIGILRIDAVRNKVL